MLPIGAIPSTDGASPLEEFLDADGRHVPVVVWSGERVDNHEQGLPPRVCALVEGTPTFRSWRKTMRSYLAWPSVPRLNRRYDLFNALSGSSPAIDAVRGFVEHCDEHENDILLIGEVGTDKDLIARLVHARSVRSTHPFLPLNCRGLTSGLLESELFGHERNAFPGALSARAGRIETASGGTILLQYVEEMPPSLQQKLADCMSNQHYSRVGSAHLRTSNIRVFATVTSAACVNVLVPDLQDHFRNATLQVPALRERRLDIPVLIAEHVRRAQDDGRAAFEISATAMAAICQYDWPENLRELRSLCDRLTKQFPYQVVEPENLPARMARAPRTIPSDVSRDAELGVAEDQPNLAKEASVTIAAHAPSGTKKCSFDLRSRVSELEVELIVEALSSAEGIVSNAAKRLNINRTTLVEKMRKYRITKSAT